MAGKSMRGGLAAVFVAVVAGIMFAGYNYLLLRKRKREEEGAESQARKTAKGKESGEEEESVSDEQTGNSPHLTFSIEDVDHETEYQSRDYRRDIVVPAAGDIPIPSAPPPTRNTSENGLSEAFSSPSSTQDSFRNLVNNLSSIQDVAFVEEKLNSLNSADNESQGNTNSEPSSWVNVEENSSFQSASSLSPEKSEPSSWVKVEKDEQTGDPRDPFGSTPFEEALKAIGCSETAEVPPAGETDETKEVPQSAKSSRDSVSPSKVPEQVLERAPLLGFDDREDLPNQADIFATEREASVEPSSSASGEEAEAEPQEQDEGVSEEDATECLENVQRRPGELGPREAQVLVSLLSTRDYDLLEKVLKTIQNAAAFTSCQKTLSDAGCLKKLHHLLRAHSMAIRMGQSVSYPAVVSGVATTINNLAMNTANQKELKDCIPTLIDFAVSEKSPEPVQLSALQALTNLSVMSEYHRPYTQLVQTLYEYLDTRHSEVQLQALKVLVNLSTNADMVPHLLAARAPSCVLELLVPDTSTDLLLRWLTLLGNIMHTAKEQGITYASLPTDYKAPSPETMYSALYGMKESMHVRSKVFVLSKHENEDIRYHAARVYSSL